MLTAMPVDRVAMVRHSMQALQGQAKGPHSTQHGGMRTAVPAHYEVGCHRTMHLPPVPSLKAAVCCRTLVAEYFASSKDANSPSTLHFQTLRFACSGVKQHTCLYLQCGRVWRYLVCLVAGIVKAFDCGCTHGVTETPGRRAGGPTY